MGGNAMKKKLLLALILSLSVFLSGCINGGNEAQPNKEGLLEEKQQPTDKPADAGQGEEVYANTQYGLDFTLPESWQGYSIVTGKWEGFAPGGSQPTETGAMISIRHPQWTSEAPRQDIPIMILALTQWESLEQGEFHIGAAPVGPRELGRNNSYVFALPARYNYAFPTGYEEVENILAGGPLQARVPGN